MGMFEYVLCIITVSYNLRHLEVYISDLPCMNTA